MAGSGTSHLRSGAANTVLQVEHLVVEFPSPRGTVHAVSDVSLDLMNRETLGIVGESGCGKSTTGKAIMRVPPPTSGKVLLGGTDLSTLDLEQMRDARGQLQMIFQDAISSLNPRRKVREIVAEPLVIRWLEEQRRSPLVLAWERYVPAMLKIWKNRWIRLLIMPIVVAFFVGLVLWIVATRPRQPERRRRSRRRPRRHDRHRLDDRLDRRGSADRRHLRRDRGDLAGADVGDADRVDPEVVAHPP